MARQEVYVYESIELLMYALIQHSSLLLKSSRRARQASGQELEESTTPEQFPFISFHQTPAG